MERTAGIFINMRNSLTLFHAAALLDNVVANSESGSVSCSLKLFQTARYNC